MLKSHASNKYYRLLVFWVGIIATVAYRLVVVLNYYSAFWVEVAWYIGTVGFVWYFAHRFRVGNNREQLIVKKKLIYKILRNQRFSDDDRDALAYILKSLRSSKARWNYIAIFLFSALALLYGLYADITRLLY